MYNRLLGDEWVLPNFNPLSGIPTAVTLTTYSGEATDIFESKLQEYVHLVASEKLTLKTGPVLRFGQRTPLTGKQSSPYERFIKTSHELCVLLR